jgi:hypothetical protein
LGDVEGPGLLVLGLATPLRTLAPKGSVHRRQVDAVIDSTHTRANAVDGPYLEEEDIQAALNYAAWLADESVYTVERVPA